MYDGDFSAYFEHHSELGNPGRPIVTFYSYPTECVSAFIDAHLQPIVKSLPSYIKDTNHFLDII
jgi:hypothetical protein